MMDGPDYPSRANSQAIQAERDGARAARRLAAAERRVADAQRDAAAAASAAAAALHGERARTLALQAALDEVHASTSWRISHPVRVASRLLQALRPAPPSAPLPPLPAAAFPAAEPPKLAPRAQAMLDRLQGRWPD